MIIKKRNFLIICCFFILLILAPGFWGGIYFPKFYYLYLFNSILFFVLIVLVLAKNVISRTIALQRELETIGQPGGLKNRLQVKDRDEISKLAENINRMLDKLENYQLEIKKSEEKFRNIFFQSPIGIELFDSDGFLTEVNQACLEIFGVLDKKDVRGFKLFEDPNISEEDREKLKQFAAVKYEALFDFEKVKSQHLYPTSKSGTIYLLVQITPLGTRDCPQGFLVQLMDVTLNKKSMEEIKKSYGLLQTVIEGTTDAVFVRDTQGRHLLVNSATAMLLGKKSEEIIGQDVRQLLSDPEALQIMEDDQAVISSGQPQTFEEQITLQDKPLTLLTVKAPYRDTSGQVIGLIGVARNITERKRIEQTLQFQSEIINNLSEGVHLIRINDGVIVYTNRRLDEMFGYGPGELIGKHVSLLNAPAATNPEEKAHEIINYLQAHNIWRGEIKNIKKDGSHFWCFASVTVFNHPEYGRVCISVHADITEIKRTQEEIQKLGEDIKSHSAQLEKTQTYLANIIDSIGNPLFVKDRQHRWVLLNDAFCKFMGKAREELIGKSDYDFFPKSEADVFWSKDETVFNSRDTNINEEDFTDSLGVTHVILTKKEFYQDNTGDQYIVGIITDITAIKKGEEELRKLHTAIEQSLSSIVITDKDARIEYVNPYFTVLTGYSFEEVKGQNPRILKSGEKPPEEYRRLWQTLTSGQEWRGEFHNRKKNGELYWEYASISPIRNPRGEVTHYIAIKEDITERKRIERELEKALIELENKNKELIKTQKELIQTEKMAAIGQFAANLAHEINNPMGNISSAAQLCLANFEHDNFREFIQKYLKIIQKNSEIASSLVRELLNFAKPGGVIFEKGDIREQILQTLDLVQPRMSIQKIELLEKIDQDLPALYFDHLRLKNAFLNIIINALDAMPDGGKLTVSASYDVPRQEAVIVIQDTGIGIKGKDINKIFEPFFSTKGHGFGLGLSMSQQVIHFHQGQIAVESLPDQGTKFTITLPNKS